MVETRAELPFIGDQVGLFKPRPARLSIVPVEMSRKEAELPFIGDQVGLSRAQPGHPTWPGPDAGCGIFAFYLPAMVHRGEERASIGARGTAKDGNGSPLSIWRS